MVTLTLIAKCLIPLLVLFFDKDLQRRTPENENF